MQKINTERTYWLDVSRVFAIFFVSLNHSILCSYSIYTNQFAEFCELGKLETLFKAVIYVLSRIGVPLFLMISGALLLSKPIDSEEDIYRFYKHNWLGLLITSEIWYVIMFFVVYFEQAMIPISCSNILLSIPQLINTMLFLKTGPFVSLWYIPMILCVYTLIPFFALVLRKCGVKVFIVPAVIVFVSAMLIPNVNYTLEMIGSAYRVKCVLGAEDVFSMYMLYVLIGYAVYNKLLCNIKTIHLLIWLAGSLGFAVSWQYVCFLNAAHNIRYEFIAVLLISMLLFELFRRFADCWTAVKKPVTYLARIAFGIYFVHVIIMFYLERTVIFKELCQFQKFWYVEIISMLGSILFIAVVSKISWCKKYLFMIK